MVAFENGDTRRPVVLGAMFNGKDKPGDELLQEKKGSFAVVSTEKGFIHTKDDLTIHADKKMILQIDTDVEEKIKGKSSNETTGEMKTKTSASYTLEAGSSLKIKGATIDDRGLRLAEAQGRHRGHRGLRPDVREGRDPRPQGQGMTNVKGGIINLG